MSAPHLNECAEILRAAQRYAVPAAALVALRVVENGGPGREYGVLSVPAPTYRDQVDVAANSLRNSEARYRAHTEGQEPRVGGHYTDDFLVFFSSRWAPPGAGNDPRGLNRNHARNLVAAYQLARD